jgi:hypothetical protein
MCAFRLYRLSAYPFPASCPANIHGTTPTAVSLRQVATTGAGLVLGAAFIALGARYSFSNRLQQIARKPAAAAAPTFPPSKMHEIWGPDMTEKATATGTPLRSFSKERGGHAPTSIKTALDYIPLTPKAKMNYTDEDVLKPMR